jgi:hypothetical protein
MGTVDLEPLVLAAMARHQADIVEHRAGVEKLPIERQSAVHSGERAEMIDSARMVEEQVGFDVADVLGDRARHLAVGDGGCFDYLSHHFLPRFLLVRTINPRYCVSNCRNTANADKFGLRRTRA